MSLSLRGKIWGNPSVILQQSVVMQSPCESNVSGSENILFYVYSQIKKPEWKPDYGPAEFLPFWGATIAGARKFLIAYNINILGTKEQAHRLALNIRTQGRGPDQVQ